MKYSDKLMKEVERLYHNRLYNSLVKIGDESLARFLYDESFGTSLSIDFILETIKKHTPDKAVKILKEEAETLKAKQELYELCAEELKRFHEDERENY